MGWLEKAAQTKIGGLFINTDKEIPDNLAQNGANPNKGVPSAGQRPRSFHESSFQIVPSTLPVGLTEVHDNVDPEIRGKIQSIADHADQVSFTRFMELVKNMRTSFPDEATCYRAAFAAGKAFNLPVLEVLRGLDAVLSDLSKTENQFKSAVPQRIAAKVGSRREKITQLQQTVSAKRDEIQRLQEQADRLNLEIGQLTQAEQLEQAAISQDEKGVRDDAEKFQTALQAVMAPYIAERKKIELFGKEA